MPTVKQRDWPHLYVSTLCPLCKAGGYWPDEVWLGSCDGGLFRLNQVPGATGVWEQFLFDNPLIEDVAVTSDGTLWVSVWTVGVFSFDGMTWTEYPIDTTSPYTSGPRNVEEVRLCADANGGMWFGYGSSAIGVSYYDGSTWAYYSGFGKYGDYDNIVAIGVAPNGYVWFLQDDSYDLPYYTGSEWLYVEFPVGDAPLAYSLDIASDGVVWVGTWVAVYKYEDEEWTKYSSGGAEGLRGSRFFAILADGSGNAWAGSAFGSPIFLQYFNGTSWSNVTPTGLGTEVSALELTSDGTLWVGTWWDGVWKYGDEVWTQYINSNSGFASPTNNLYAHHIVVQVPSKTLERLARDAQAWREHLIRVHGAAGGMGASHWENTGQYGDDEGRWDTRVGWLHRFAFKCYACGQVFATNALLVSHMSTVHLS